MINHRLGHGQVDGCVSNLCDTPRAHSEMGMEQSTADELLERERV